MGYACPVCDVPQRDAEHLANHLAFTAMLHSDAHESWLDEHTPGWNEEGSAELTDRIAERVDGADDADYDEVFEDTTDDHDHAHEEPFDHASDSAADAIGGTEIDRGPAAADDETAQVLSEARELTRRMRSDDSEDGSPADATDVDEADDET